MRSAMLATSLILCLPMAACRDEADAVVQLMPSVVAAPVVAVDLEEEIRASGELQARNHTLIAAEVQGRVTQISIDEGGAVSKGSVVLELDPERRRLELDAARAGLAQARAQLSKERSQTARVRKLRTSSVSSEAQLEEAETALRLAESSVAAERAQLGVAQRALADASVAAPFDGVVSMRSVQLGEFVQPGATLFEIVALDPLEAIFHVTELDSARVKVGQPVKISVAAQPDREFIGEVRFVAPTVDPATRTLRIKASVANTDGLLRPGLFARANLGVSRRHGVVMVPEESIIQRADGAFLYRIRDDDRVERVPVATGTEYDGSIEVLDGLAVGERVVRRGHGGLADGSLVEVRVPPGGAVAKPSATAGGREAGPQS